MVLKYHISSAPSLLEDMVVKIWEAASDGPGAEVYTQTIPQPHSSPTTITVNGLDKVVHIVRLYAAVSGNLLHNYNAEPLTDSVETFSPIRFKIGDGGALTPAANSDTYTDPALVGLTTDDFMVMRNNVGLIFPAVHYSFNSSTGSVVLSPPDVFNDQEEITIIRMPQNITTPVNDSVVGKWFGGFVDIVVNTNYSNTHLRKLIRFNGTCTYTFQAGDTIPVGYAFCFQHFGATDGIGTISFLNGPLKWDSSTKASITIPRYSEGVFVWDGTNWNVVVLSNSSYVNAAATLPNAIVGAGQYRIQYTGYADGDVPIGDPTWTIIHNLNIAGDYLVQISLKTSTAAYASSNRVTHVWYHHATDKPNKFNVSLQELSAEGQDITICWTIIKL